MKNIILLSLAALVMLAACTHYTHDRPDTAPNIAGFERHFGFAPPPDVSELYYYADELADVKYQLGFKADASTIQEIISRLALKQAPPDFEVGLAREFPWWQASDLESLTPCWKENPRGDYYWFLWYAAETRQAWFIEFSL